MLLTKSSHVCIPCINSVISRVCLTKVRFFAFFGSDIKKKKIGSICYMYLKALLILYRFQMYVGILV